MRDRVKYAGVCAVFNNKVKSLKTLKNNAVLHWKNYGSLFVPSGSFQGHHHHHPGASGSSPKILGNLALGLFLSPTPQKYLSLWTALIVSSHLKSLSVTKTEKLQKSGGSHKLGAWAPWPQRKTAPVIIIIILISRLRIPERPEAHWTGYPEAAKRQKKL